MLRYAPRQNSQAVRPLRPLAGAAAGGEADWDFGWDLVLGREKGNWIMLRAEPR